MTTQKRKLSEFAEPGMGGPEMGVSAAGAENAAAQNDNEGAMAKADLYKLASYSHKLYQQIQNGQQLEGWVQAKITKAADYIASVYHYLEYEMKFSEYGHHLDNSDTLSESQKNVLRAKLNEAKDMVRQIKITQAEKVASKTELHEGHGMVPCAECDGTGMVQQPERDWDAVPQSVKDKFRNHDVKTRAYHAAMKRIDAEESAVDGEEEEVSEATKTPTTWTDKSGKKHPATSVKGDKYKGDEAEKEAKQKKVDEATKTPTTWTDKSGKKHPATSVKGDKYKGDEAEKETKGKKVDEATKTPTTWTDKSGKKHPATSVKGDKYKGDEAEKEAKQKKVDEGKPSAGLSKAKKSATVKKAKAGGDIGKPGKGFAKVAAKAAKEYGSKEKGEKVAAAMWKNIKETTAYVMEKAAEAKKANKDYDHDGKIETGSEEHAGAVDNAIKASKKTVKESTDFTRMQDQLARLNRSESHVLKESSEADQIRALSKRLLG